MEIAIVFIVTLVGPIASAIAIIIETWLLKFFLNNFRLGGNSNGNTVNITLASALTNLVIGISFLTVIAAPVGLIGGLFFKIFLYSFLVNKKLNNLKASIFVGFWTGFLGTLSVVALIILAVSWILFKGKI